MRSIVSILIAGALVALLPATALHADDESGPYRVVPNWPVLPDGWKTGEAAGVDVDSHNHVLLFHRGEHPIMRFDAESGELLASWGDGMFKNAHGLEVDDHDNVWVTDTLLHQVLKFDHDGKLLLTVGEKEVSGLDGAHFNQPTDVFIAPNGDFYVSDGYGNSRVAKFDANGKFLLDWGKKGDAPGEFNLPHGITMDAEGRVYVADRSNLRIQVFDGNGKFLHMWKSDALGRPWGLQFTSDGHIFVMDGGDMAPNPPHRAKAMKLDLEGNILETWGSYGPDAGQFSWGHDIAVGANGSVYTVEVRNNLRIQKFVRR